MRLPLRQPLRRPSRPNRLADESPERFNFSPELFGGDQLQDISTDGERNAPLPTALTLPIDELISRAFAGRPDLMAQMLEIRKVDAEIRNSESAYWPKITVSANVAQTAGWPAAQLGQFNTPTWAAGVSLEWTLFDGGARKNKKEVAESHKREAAEELRDKRDQAQREVWSSYIAFRTALRQHEAAVALLQSSETSYSASLDAYNMALRTSWMS